MIETLSIDGYRGFEHFEMKGLGRINLLVGRNSAGKTSVLEAIRLLRTGLTAPVEIPGVLWAIAARRGEVEADHARLRHIQHWRAGARSDVVSISQEAGTIRLRCADDHGWKLKLARDADALAPDGLDKPRWHLADVDALARPRDLELRDQAGWAVHPVVGPEMASPLALAEMFGRVVLSPEEDALVEALQLIDPRIRRLGATSGEHPQLLVKLDGFSDRVPLGHLGGGVRRFAQLWLSFALAGENPLLIDEIDAGLHHTVMVDMWHRVHRLAVERDVQVFATTHSWDCVSALGAMCLDGGVSAEQVMLHRIDPGGSRPVSYTGDRIGVAVEHGIEVR